jgi:uncharacterized protein (DUF885 family)
MKRKPIFLLMLGMCFAACEHEPPPQPPPERSQASRDLEALAAEFWSGTLEARPALATALGERRYDDRLEDISVGGKAREEARLERSLELARSIPDAALNVTERMTRSALIHVIERDLAAMECAFEEWLVDPVEGPQVALLEMESFQPVRSVEEGRAMVARWHAVAPYMEVHIASLRRGLEAGKVATSDSVQQVIDQLRDLLALPNRQWALLRPLQDEHPDWRAGERAEFRAGLSAAVRESARPALNRYLRFLEREILPRARPQRKAGLLHLPGGLACYRRLIRAYTSLDLPPDDVHGIGLAELERMRAETKRLGSRLSRKRGRKDSFDRLRSDPRLRFKTREEVESAARASLTRASASLPRWLATPPRAACEVVRMAGREEKHPEPARYRPPAADGSRPGRLTINTRAPRARPRYETEALVYQEAIPGRHVQEALAQELVGVPDFRRYLGAAVHTEGWALYATRLAAELGLYSTDLDRMAMLSNDARMACRLMMDTGIHAKGWSRRMAVRFLQRHAALTEERAAAEVDRCISHPGEALAGKVGQLEIKRLREMARKRLGKRFDLGAFHDAVLGNGAVPIDSLRLAIEEHVNWSLAPLGPVGEIQRLP